MLWNTQKYILNNEDGDDDDDDDGGGGDITDIKGKYD